MTPVQEQYDQLEPLKKNDKLNFLLDAGAASLEAFLSKHPTASEKRPMISENAATPNIFNNISSTNQAEILPKPTKYNRNDIKNQIRDLLELIEGGGANSQSNATDGMKKESNTNNEVKVTQPKRVMSSQPLKRNQAKNITACPEENKKFSAKNKLSSPARPGKDEPLGNDKTTPDKGAEYEKFVSRPRTKSSTDASAVLNKTGNSRLGWKGQLFAPTLQKVSSPSKNSNSIEMQNALYEISTEPTSFQAINTGNKQQCLSTATTKLEKQVALSPGDSSIQSTSSMRSAPGKTSYKNESFLTKLIQKNSK